MHESEGEYISIGKMCERTGLTFLCIRRALEEIGLQPDFTLNGLRYFSDDAAWPVLRDYLIETEQLQPPSERAAARISYRESLFNLSTRQLNALYMVAIKHRDVERRKMLHAELARREKSQPAQSHEHHDRTLCTREHIEPIAARPAVDHRGEPHQK